MGVAGCTQSHSAMRTRIYFVTNLFNQVPALFKGVWSVRLAAPWGSGTTPPCRNCPHGWVLVSHAALAPAAHQSVCGLRRAPTRLLPGAGSCSGLGACKCGRPTALQVGWVWGPRGLDHPHLTDELHVRVHLFGRQADPYRYFSLLGGCRHRNLMIGTIEAVFLYV